MLRRIAVALAASAIVARASIPDRCDGRRNEWLWSGGGFANRGFVNRGFVGRGFAGPALSTAASSTVDLSAVGLFIDTLADDLRPPTRPVTRL